MAQCCFSFRYLTKLLAIHNRAWMLLEFLLTTLWRPLGSFALKHCELGETGPQALIVPSHRQRSSSRRSNLQATVVRLTTSISLRGVGNDTSFDT